MIRFLPDYAGALMGLPTDKKHLNYKWNKPDCKILFSVCRQGNAASCHFATDKRGLKKLKTAINEFIDFVFKNFEWCEMIFAKVSINSIKRLSEKLGFVLFANIKKHGCYFLSKEDYYGRDY